MNVSTRYYGAMNLACRFADCTELIRPLTASIIRRVTLTAALILVGAPFVSACSVPVFRYALERWQSDLFEVDVFFRDELTPAERALVSKLEDQSLVNGGTVNWEIVHCRVDGDLAPDLATVRNGLGDVPLPHVVVRMPGGRYGSPIIWTGPLTDAQPVLWNSPGRTQLVKHLLAGDSVVWLVFRGSDDEQFQAVRRNLQEQLPALAEKTPLPAGVGLPGSEVLTELPLEVRFSTIVVEGEAEAAFRQSIAATFAEPPAATETMVVPVFGRGRAMAAIPGSDFDAALLEEIARFLCGACSCQVKQANPGFDLLLAVNWNERLFGGDPAPVEIASSEPAADPGPSYVAVPEGSSDAGDVAPSHVTVVVNDEPASELSFARRKIVQIGSVVLAVLLITAIVGWTRH